MTQALQLWNEGPAKSAIVDFIERVTRAGGADYVPPAARIATFDNDGTLWCEQPLQVQIFFAFDRVRQLAAQDPSLGERQPFKAFLERDLKRLASLGKEAIFKLATATHTGMSVEEFDTIAHDWFARARHPVYDRLFKQCYYSAQVELLAHLRNNGFRIFLVSAGGTDLMRAISEECYGIAREQVIGSSLRTHLELQRKGLTLIKSAELYSFNDRDAKPQNIGLHVGRRPILAFGNSDGDLAMLRYTLSGDGARLALLLHHDDAGREVAYDRDFHISPLNEALERAQEYGITVVSMKRDWRTVFPEKRAGD